MKKKILFLLPFVLFSCSDESFNDASEQTADPVEEVSSLTRAALTAIPSNQERVVLSATTRAEGELEPGTLQLVAEIKNPSKSEDEENDFVIEESDYGRFLSATCVYYDDATDTYYATYHMQGNNYNTQLENDVAGFIETFKVDANGVASLQNIYRSADPSKLDFDFNHLYFDNLEQHANVTSIVKENRIIAVGHKSEPVTSGTGVNSAAIIAKLNLSGEPYIDYKVVYTGDRILDEETGKSLGAEDAQDVNAVVRRYDTYYLATRKGIALLQAKNDSLFEPMIDRAGNNYFVKTPGSVKHVAYDGGYSKVSFLYLTEDFPENFQYKDAIKAKLVKFDIYNSTKNISNPNSDHIGYLGSGNTWGTLLTDVKSDNFLDYVQSDAWNIEFDRPVSPVDGKNVLFLPSVGESQYYAALGKAGLYFRNNNNQVGRIDCGNRPVNGVYADDGHGKECHNGFIYVCNGAKLSIYNRYKLDEVASWNLPNDVDGSANYVIAREAAEANEDGTHDRIITVAFGQAGIKIFRFRPKGLW